MSLAHLDEGGNAPVRIDHAAILRALKLNPQDPNTQALLLVCERYGLDPLMKHMVLIQGSPYVTRDGYLAIAHGSGQFDGIEVVAEGETDTHYLAKVAVYRKDMTRPFTYSGRFPKHKEMAKQYGPEMAVKVAEVAALRRAFNVTGISAADERWDVAPDDTVDATSSERPALPSGPSMVPAGNAKKEIIDAFLVAGHGPEAARARAIELWGDRGSEPIDHEAFRHLVGIAANTPPAPEPTPDPEEPPFTAEDRTLEPKISPLPGKEPVEVVEEAPEQPVEAEAREIVPIGNSEGQRLHREIGAILSEAGRREAWIKGEIIFCSSGGRTTHASELTNSEAVTAKSYAQSIAAGTLPAEELKAANDDHRSQAQGE